MEHITFKGTTAYPSTRAISEAIEGVGGSFNAATDRESTVYWVRVPRREAERAMDVLGELIVRPQPRRRTRSTSERDGDHRGDPLATSTTRPSTARSCSRPAMFGDGPLGREICGEEAGHPGPARRRRSTTSGGATTGRPTPSSRSPATSTTTRPSSWPRRRSGRATARSRASRRRRPCPAGPRVLHRQARHQPGPARAWASRRSTATTPTAGRSPSSTRSSATG